MMVCAYQRPSGVTASLTARTTLMKLDAPQDVLAANLSAGTSLASLSPGNVMELLTVQTVLMNLIVHCQLQRHVHHLNLPVRMEAA